MTTQSLHDTALEIAKGLVNGDLPEQDAAKNRYNEIVARMSDNERLDFAIKVAQLAEVVRHGEVQS